MVDVTLRHYKTMPFVYCATTTYVFTILMVCHSNKMFTPSPLHHFSKAISKLTNNNASDILVQSACGSGIASNLKKRGLVINCKIYRESLLRVFFTKRESQKRGLWHKIPFHHTRVNQSINIC